MKIDRVCLFGVSIALALLTAGFARATAAPFSIDVRQFGAKGDAVTDDTKAFQSAMDSLEPAGGIVNVPAGNYLIATHLKIPVGVTLQGVWTIPTAFSQMKGSTLLCVEGAASEKGTPFITLSYNSALKGMTVFYPKQNPNAIVPYPWCVSDQAGPGGDASIVDCLLVNPYQGVDLGSHTSGRHYIRNLYGQPLRMGIYVSQSYDIGRIENVHFWPFWYWSKSKYLQKWMIDNGEAFVFGRADWEYVLNTFVFGYGVGYRFIKTPDGCCNGNFSGIGADDSGVAVKVDQAWPYGLLITNGEFVAMEGDTKTQVVVSPANTGVVQFANCSFWGPSTHIANIAGNGYVTFNACNLRGWNPAGAAIVSSGGGVTANACIFGTDAPQLQLSAGAGGAVFLGNQITGALRIENPALAELQQGFNVSRAAAPIAH